MSKKFDVNNVDLEIIDTIEDRVEDIEGKADYNLRQISLKEIALNEKNNFRISDIDELAESLKKYGQLHNAVVRKINENQYRLISGERRFKAAQSLGWESIACKIIECDDLDEEILLITANLDTRELNDIERSKNAQRLFELITEKRKSGEKFDGKKTREVVAEKLNVAPATVQKLVNLKKLIPEFEKMVEDKQIGLELANQYAQMNEEIQKTVYEAIQDGLKLTAKTAKELKDKLKKTEDHSKNTIDNLKNEIKEREEKLKLESEERKQLINIHNREMENQEKLINQLKGTIENIKLESAKEKENLESIRSNIRFELQQEINKANDEDKIKKLQEELDKANDDILNSNIEAEKQIKELINKVSELEISNENIKYDYEKKLSDTKKEAQRMNTLKVEKNLEILILAKSAAKLLSSLKNKIDDKSILNDEVKNTLKLIFEEVEYIK